MYLNGALWSTGTGKTLPIEITTLMLGGNPGMEYPYFGKIDEFSLWNTELSLATIQAWREQIYHCCTPKLRQFDGLLQI